MSTKHPCGCMSNDTHYVLRCPYHAAMDAEYTRAFFAKESARPESVWWTHNTEGLL